MTSGHSPTASSRALVRKLPLAALCPALCITLGLMLAPAAVGRVMRSTHTPRPSLAPVTVGVDTSHPGAVVPAGFLGLSFETSNLRQIAGYAEMGNLVTLMRSLGPGELRFGGGSADTRVAWTDGTTPRPSWASSVINPGDLGQLAVLAAKTGWRVVLTIGLAHYDPVAGAREAAAAKAALGESLEAIELGNEPNAFAQHGLRSEPWTFVQYDAEVAAYRTAIEAAAPGIPLAGPDVSGSGGFETWGLGEVIDQRPAELTGHHYPLGCEQTPPPSIARLLSPLIYRKEGGSLHRYMSIAQAAETPFRLDETNTVSCGGTAGISDTFASALWAVGYIPRVMSMEAVGINLHGNPANCNGYAPLCAPTSEGLLDGMLVAQPEWYALLLAKELIGERPVVTSMHSPGRPNVHVTAFLAPDGRLRFVLVDDDPPGKRASAVALRLGSAYGGASVLSLTGPSPGALSGTTLGGRAVAPDGSWTPARLPGVPNRQGTVTVVLEPSSAALVTVSPGEH